MALHPEMREMLDKVAAWRDVNGASKDWPDERLKLEVIRDQIWKRELLPVASVEEFSIPGPAGGIPVRVYRPAVDGPVPTLLYLHGGAFAVGDLNSHESHSRRICNQLGIVVMAVDYRLAPENPFPAGYDDCWAAYRWALDNIDRLGGLRDKVALGGDSAGGNLSLAVAIQARDEGLPVAATMLAYGVFDLVHDEQWESMRSYGIGYGLSINPDDEDPMPFYLGKGGKESTKNDFRVNPLLADMAGVAPAVIVCGECDPLSDQSTALDAKMRAAGVRTIYRIEPGFIHSFMNMAGSPAAVTVTQNMIDDLGTLLQ